MKQTYLLFLLGIAACAGQQTPVLPTKSAIMDSFYTYVVQSHSTNEFQHYSVAELKLKIRNDKSQFAKNLMRHIDKEYEKNYLEYVPYGGLGKEYVVIYTDIEYNDQFFKTPKSVAGTRR